MSTKKMKLLFENWRGYLEEDQYLDENDYLIEEDYIDEQSIFGDDADKTTTAGLDSVAAGVEQAEPSWLDDIYNTADTALKANPGYVIRDKLGQLASKGYEAAKGWLSDQFSDETRPMSQRPHATMPKGALHMPDVQLQMPDMFRSDYLADRPFGHDPNAPDPNAGVDAEIASTGGWEGDHPLHDPYEDYSAGITGPDAPQTAWDLEDMSRPEDDTVPPPQQSQKAPSPQDEIDKLKGFGSKFRKARELGMTKFKHKGKTFGTRLAKRKPKTVAAPTPTPGLSPREKELKSRTLAGIKRGHDAATALKVAKMQMNRRRGAEDARARERAVSRELGPGGVMGVAQNTRIPPMNENRRPSRRRPSKRLKMRVNRLTKTTK